VSITIEFGRWGAPYLISIGRWEWTCFHTAEVAARGRPHWHVVHSPGGEQQYSETIVHCGGVAHCFTWWPKRTPLPRASGR
jgi:hypothetical protein